jgi:post-segregation antitoxin (ccd killing protein)
MRTPHYDRSAKKRTVSLTLNGDLCAKAQAQALAQGINISEVAEAALAEALALRLGKRIQAEIEQDIAVYNAYVDKHGSPAAMLRDHLADRDDAA